MTTYCLNYLSNQPADRRLSKIDLQSIYSYFAILTSGLLILKISHQLDILIKVKKAS